MHQVTSATMYKIVIKTTLGYGDMHIGFGYTKN